MSEIIVVSNEPKPVAPPVEAADKLADISDAAKADEKGDASEASEQESDEEGKEASDDKEVDEDGKPKKKNGFRKRIDGLRKRLSLAEQERDYFREQAFKGKPADSKPDANLETATGKPKEEAYATHAEYVEALTDWKVDQREQLREQKEKEKQAQAETKTKVSTYEQRAESFRKEHADYDDVLADCEAPLSKFIHQTIIESDNGPELAYALAQNPEELERISKLSDTAAARELGKFESKHLDAPEKKESKEIKLTNAKKPITPLGGGSTGSAKKSIYDDNLSQAEFEKLRAEQLASRGA